MTKKVYYKISPYIDLDHVVVWPSILAETLEEVIDELEVGKSVKVEKVKMTEKEFNEIPEY